ncbi:transposase, partial [Acinetobacter guillouiae]
LPIAPLDQTLCDATGRYSTFTDEHKIKETHLNALCEQIEHIESLPIEKKLVHIIDREGDSIAHLRLLNQQEHLFLIRGKEGNRVEYQGEDVKLREVSDQIPTTQTHTIQYKGNCEQLYVGETQISITRNARPMQKDETGKRVPPQKGKSLTVRLIVVEVKNKQGKSLSRWSLLSNVSSEIPSIELATWYYWRWKIENYFKLLKQ